MKREVMMTATANSRRQLMGSVAKILPIGKLVQLAGGGLTSGGNFF